MEEMQDADRHDWLGVMGRDLSMNMADHGFSVAGYDKDQAKLKP